MSRSRRHDGERGAVLPIVALSLGFIILMTAFTIDLGRQILRRRDMQAIADVVSLDMARLVNGRTRDEILSASATPNWNSELSLSAQRNDFTTSGLAWKLGNIVSGDFQEDTVGTDRPTAVQITASDSVAFFFVPGSGNVSRSAVSTLGGEACFSIGSFAASLNANPGSLLPQFLNSALNVSAISYNGLANAQVNMRQLAAKLGIGTPEQLFTTTVSRRDLYLATASALNDAGDTADATVLNSIASQTNGSSTVNFGQIVTVEQGGEQAALDTAFNVLDIVSGSAFLANGSNALSIPSISLGVPSITSASASVKVIEGPQQGCRRLNGLSIGNTQVEITLNMSVSLGPISVATVKVVMNMASAAGTLINPLSCGPPGLINVNVQGRLASATITQTIGPAVTTISPGAPSSFGNTVSFTLPPDTLGQKKQSGSGDVGLTSTNITTLAPGVQVALSAAFPVLDNLIDRPFAQRIGLRVAGADVTPISLTCNDVLLSI